MFQRVKALEIAPLLIPLGVQSRIRLLIKLFLAHFLPTGIVHNGTILPSRPLFLSFLRISLLKPLTLTPDSPA